MKKYIVWCRWAAHMDGGVERDKFWNVVPDQTRSEPFHWAYNTQQAASERASAFASNWQPGLMETLITEVELPD